MPERKHYVITRRKRSSQHPPGSNTIPTGKKLIFTDPDTNEGGIITLENLSKQILQNLTSQTFTLDQGNLTLLQALNQLNSNSSRVENRIQFEWHNKDEKYPSGLKLVVDKTTTLLLPIESFVKMK